MKTWMIAALSLLSLAACTQPEPFMGPAAPYAIPFAGEWNGTWSNSVGQKGPDSLILSEDAAGHIHGLWTGEVSVAGRRVNPTTAELHGETATRSYLLMATISGTQDMVLNYLAAPLDSTGSYQEVAHFSRTR
jgi:hypothetical protein